MKYELDPTLVDIRNLRERIRSLEAEVAMLHSQASNPEPIVKTKVPDTPPLAETEVYYPGMLGDMPIGILITDKEGNFIYANEEAIQMGQASQVGFNLSEVNQTWQVEWPDGRKMAAEDYPAVRVIKTGEVFTDFPLVFRRLDGTRCHAWSHTVPVFDENNHIRGAAIYVIELNKLPGFEHLNQA